MLAYEIVRLDQNGNEIGRQRIVCADEEEALDRMAALNHRLGLELWSGERLVCRWGPAFAN